QSPVVHGKGRGGCRIANITRPGRRTTMATITHNGVTLSYEDRGVGKPAFVFVHGSTCNRSFFAPQAAYFAPRHRVVSLDLRGHGDSTKPERAYPLKSYADDIAHVIDQPALGKVVALG